MPCELWREKLAAYLDGELPSSEGDSLRSHLRECVACANEALERAQIKRAVGIAGRRYEASAQFREKIRQSVSKGRQRRDGTWLWRLAALPAALVLILSLGVGYYFQRQRTEREIIYSELTDLHVTTLASSSPVDVLSTDRHTVK